MSLDLDIHVDKWTSYDEGATFLKENYCVHDSNITHNLTKMAHKSGLYNPLWDIYKYTDDDNKVLARYLISDLEEGLKELKSNPEKYKQFNSPNSWGMYKHFVPFVEKFLKDCKEYPNGEVYMSK